jgi:serine/threonine protein kinase/tetratricopeptide (TPR) repeat protein
MNPSAPQEADRQERLGQILAEWLEAAEQGRPPQESEYLRRYPDFGPELADCFADWKRFPRPHGSAERTQAIGEPLLPENGLLGDFRILREIGRGGMGIVYEAEQISLGRRVALKVLPFSATMDPRQLQRFHNEARAAAGLHHTNIVPVFAVGSERGVHYYAMQFIEGRTLAELIAQQRAGARSQELTGGSSAAASAATAHVAAQVTSAAPRDAAYFRQAAEWGVQGAEALDSAHALGVVHRDVKPANLLIDTTGRLWVTDFGLAQIRSDARLTLTGDLVGTLRYMSPEQALAKRLVIDHRTDVYSLGATLYELLTLQPAFAGSDRQELLRQIAFEEPKAPRRVNKAIPPELETIVLKALEKSPADRYATAKDLADDLRRFLEDRPIRAKKPTLRQRARKWAHRHQGVVLGCLVALAVASLPLAGSTAWVWREMTAKEKALGLAEVREQEAQRLRGEAAAASKQTMDTLRATTDDVMEQLIGAKRALGPAEKSFLEKSLQRWQAFARASGVGEHSLAIRAEGALRVASLRRKLGQRDSAVQELSRQAIDLYEKLAADFPTVPEYRKGLARSHHNLGELLQDLRKHRAAEAAYRRAIALNEKLVADSPAVPEYRRLLAANHNNLSILLQDLRKHREAMAALHQGLAIEKKLAADFPRVPEYRDALANSQHNRGVFLKDLKKYLPAKTAFRQALAIQKGLVAEFPTAPLYRERLARTHLNLGDLLHTLGKGDQAEAAYGQALAAYAKLAADFPIVPMYRRQLADGYDFLGFLLKDLGKRAEAEAVLRQAVAIQERLVAESPAVPENRGALATSHNNLGALLRDMGRKVEAEAAFRQAIAIQANLAADFPSVPGYRLDLSQSYGNLGVVLYFELGKPAAAAAAFRQALAIQEKLLATSPTAAEYRELLAGNHNGLGGVLMALGQRGQAEAAIRHGLAIQEKLAADFPSVPRYRIVLGGNQCNFGHLLRSCGRPDQAIVWQTRAIATLQDALVRIKVDVTAQQFLRNAYWNRAEALDDLKRFGEAVTDWSKAVELSPKSQRPGLRMSRAASRVRAGQVDAAIKEVDELIPKADGIMTYDAACIFALASALSSNTSLATRETYAGRAVALLRQAAAKGWKDVAHMKTDPDLAPLRGRDDFKELTAELERAAPTREKRKNKQP